MDTVDNRPTLLQSFMQNELYMNCVRRLSKKRNRSSSSYYIREGCQGSTFARRSKSGRHCIILR